MLFSRAFSGCSSEPVEKNCPRIGNTLTQIDADRKAGHGRRSSRHSLPTTRLPRFFTNNRSNEVPVSSGRSSIMTPKCFYEPFSGRLGLTSNSNNVSKN
jgi:hypothetical protein